MPHLARPARRRPGERASGLQRGSGSEVWLRLAAFGMCLETRNDLSPREIDVGELFSGIVRRPAGVAEEHRGVAGRGSCLQFPDDAGSSPVRKITLTQPLHPLVRL